MVKQQSGFTLIELMIVVVIIGVLASISMPMFQKYQLRAKASEAPRNLGAIRTNEEATYTRWQSYVTATPSPRGKAALAGPAGAKNMAWTSSDGFKLLGFAAQGSVYYSYSVPDTVQTPTGTQGTDCALAEGTVDSQVDSTNPSEPMLTPTILRTGADVITILAVGNLDGDALTMCWVTGNESTQFVADPVDGGENVF